MHQCRREAFKSFQIPGCRGAWNVLTYETCRALHRELNFVASMLGVDMHSSTALAHRQWNNLQIEVMFYVCCDKSTLMILRPTNA